MQIDYEPTHICYRGYKIFSVTRQLQNVLRLLTTDERNRNVDIQTTSFTTKHKIRPVTTATTLNTKCQIVNSSYKCDHCGLDFMTAWKPGRKDPNARPSAVLFKPNLTVPAVTTGLQSIQSNACVHSIAQHICLLFRWLHLTVLGNVRVQQNLLSDSYVKEFMKLIPVK